MPETGPSGGLRRELGLWDLVFFNISALVGIRWLATAAHAGPGSVTLWALAAVGFFVPSALVVSALSKRFPTEGGLYIWTRESFGEWHGFLCGWLYWLSNLFYVPSVLLFGVGMAAYALGPRFVHLAEDRQYALTATLLMLWGGVFTNMLGLRVGKWTSNIGGASTYAAGALLIAVGLAAWTTRGSVTPIDIVPAWNWEKINFWSQIAFAFVGLELGPVMAEEIRAPEKNVPRAAWLSAACVSVFYILGTLAILVLIEPERVSILTGLAQTGAAAGERFALPWLSPVLALLAAAGVTGQVGTWMGGNARLPMLFGIHAYLPPAFAKIHPRWHSPHISLVIQGALCTLFLALMQMGETLRAGYQLLVDMAVLTAFLPFLYIFLAGWKNGCRLSGAIGFAIAAAAAVFSLVPTADTSSWLLFELKIAGGCALIIGVARLVYLRGAR
jgi:amino acid transporter